MNYGRSVFEKLAGKEQLWLEPDTENLYNQNLQHNYDLLKSNGWIDNTITYKFNSLGFRSAEFDPNKSSAMFFGCSHTMGTGMTYENTWPFIVSSNLGLECYNLGIGGGSNDAAFRLCYHYLGKLRPKVVVMLSTYNTRLETFKANDDIVQHYLNKTKMMSEDIFYQYCLLNEANLDLNKAKNIFAIRYLCSITNIPFVEFDVEEFQKIDLARDLGHYGVKSHAEFASTVLKKISRMM